MDTIEQAAMGVKIPVTVEQPNKAEVLIGDPIMDLKTQAAVKKQIDADKAERGKEAEEQVYRDKYEELQKVKDEMIHLDNKRLQLRNDYSVRKETLKYAENRRFKWRFTTILMLLVYVAFCLQTKQHEMMDYFGFD